MKNLILIFLFLILVSPVEGGDPIKSSLIDFSSGKTLSKEQRQQLAVYWSNDIYKLDNAIPDLSPSQKEWLDKEYFDEIKRAGGRFTKRSINASNSLEYNLFRAKEYSGSNSKTISILTAGVENKYLEQVLWARLATIFVDYSFAQVIFELVEKKALDKSFLLPNGYNFKKTEALHIANTMLFGNEILKKMLTPMLQQNMFGK